jgi:DNA-binding transcriptional ArsR family regulator
MDYAFRCFRALADRSRLKLVQVLLEGPAHVGALVQSTGLEQSLVSHHLKALREAGLVASERRGPFVYYTLVGDTSHELLRALGVERPSTPTDQRKPALGGGDSA